MCGACVLELNASRRYRQDARLVGYQDLCRELAASGPGTFGELDSVLLPLRHLPDVAPEQPDEAGAEAWIQRVQHTYHRRNGHGVDM